MHMRSIKENVNRSRQSNRSVNSSMTLSTAAKSIYPKCDVKKEHRKQILNLVCLTPECKLRGAICSMCKVEEHSKHHIVPVKTFLTKMREQFKGFSNQNKQDMVKEEEQGETIKESKVENPTNSYQKVIEQIQTIKNDMLGCLNLYVQALAKEIQQLEEKIIVESEVLVEKMKEQKYLVQHIQLVLNELIDMNEENETFRKKINGLVDVIKIKDEKKIQFCSNFQNNMKNWKRKSENFIKNIDSWNVKNDKFFESPFEQNHKNDQPINAHQPNLATVQKFSSEFKAKGIALSAENKVAKQTNYNSGKVVLVSLNNIKGKTVCFKICSLSTSICLGVCLKEVVKANNYKWNQSAPGHGCFVLAKNAYTYSHFDKSENMVIKGFAFATGDEISVSAKDNEVFFKKKSDNKASVSLSLKNVSPQDWKYLYFCACLNGNGDKVELVEGF